MKSKRWLISLVLAVVLVAALVLPACGEPQTYWYTPEDEKVSFDLTVSSSPTHIASMGQLLVDMLKDVGLDVTLVSCDQSTFESLRYNPTEDGWETMISWSTPGPPPLSDWAWELCGSSGIATGWNPTYWSSPEYDAIHVQLPFAANLSEKITILQGMQAVLAEDLPMIHIAQPDAIHAYRDDTWTGWYNNIGGLCSWLNPWSFLNLAPVDDATRATVAVSVIPDNLVMELSGIGTTFAGIEFYELVYANLAHLFTAEDPYEFVPRLCSSYEVDMVGDEQVWTIHLAENATWHDGVNVTAIDVETSLRYVLPRDNPSRPVNWTAVEADGVGVQPEHMLIDIINDKTLTFTYIDPISLANIPSWWMDGYIVPDHIFGKIIREESPYEEYEGDWRSYPNTEAIGAGQYELSDYQQGTHMLLELRDDLWEEIVPQAPEIMFKVYGSLETMLMALDVGDVDIVQQNLPVGRIDEFEAKDDISVNVYQGAVIYWFGFNFHMGDAVWQDKTLRQALAYAVDKVYINDILYEEYSTIPDAFIAAGVLGHNASLPDYEFSTSTFETIMLDAGYYRA